MKTRLLIIIGIIIAVGVGTLLLITPINIGPICDDAGGLCISDGARRYAMMKATCNDSTGKPDGECFVNAFEKCESARIKQMSPTFEGDPIFFYATIVPADSCSIHFEIDTSLDKWGGVTKGISETTCTDVQLSKHHLDFQCGDEQHRIQLQ